MNVQLIVMTVILLVLAIIVYKLDKKVGQIEKITDMLLIWTQQQIKAQEKEKEEGKNGR